MKDQSFGIIALNYDQESRKVLLIRHVQDIGGSGGHWSFPKGHKLEGEDAKSAALREFTEETGVADIKIVDIPPRVEHYTYKVNGKTIEKSVTFFLGLVSTDYLALQPEEIQDAAWLPISEAYNRLTFPETKAILAEVERQLASRDI